MHDCRMGTVSTPQNGTVPAHACMAIAGLMPVDAPRSKRHASMQDGSAAVVARALAANRKLQARLEGVLEAVDAAIWRNAETQAKLTCNSEAYPRAGRYRGMQGVLLRCSYPASHAHALLLLHLPTARKDTGRIVASPGNLQNTDHNVMTKT